jgi:hypothetical protein
MDVNFDPGRIRSYALLKEVYGASKARVQSNLTGVRVGWSSCQFSRCNNASNALLSAMKEIVPLSNSRSDVRSAVFPTSGTFNYRVISGTGLLSPHSFGIAIDLARDKRDYWRWASRKEGEKRIAQYPADIVRIFEKYNFIWGGKWGHFDILHYEYRPEIVLKARYFSTSPGTGTPWYEGAPADSAEVRKYIQLIDSSLN